MRAYYFDNLPGDQRLPHDSVPSRPVDLGILRRLNVEYQHVPVEGHEERLDALAKERQYQSRDVVQPSRQTLGDRYETQMATFFREHMHEDEEIRYIIDGSGYFDIREMPSDSWIRLEVSSGDLIILPAGIYHRFTLDESDKMKAMCLFKDTPMWLAHNRDEGADNHPQRAAYLRSIGI